jgi:hypothetical protein
MSHGDFSDSLISVHSAMGVANSVAPFAALARSVINGWVH